MKVVSAFDLFQVDMLSIFWVTIMTAPRSVMLGAFRGVTRAAGLSSWTEKAMIPDKPSAVLRQSMLSSLLVHCV